MIDQDEFLENGLSSFKATIVQHISNRGCAGFNMQMLDGLMKPSTRDRYYHTFQIPKKTGGCRDITAPTGVLKSVQSLLAEVLTPAIYTGICVNGFVKGRSVVTNARRHLEKNYILNIDLKDFFPSITARMVRNALVARGFDVEIAQTISALCTWTDSGIGDLPEQVLPQGAPTSPVLSNAVCWMLDYRLQGLADRFGLTYSRYADDITFSSWHSVYSKGSEFWKEMRRIISQCGFMVNEDKTRLQKKGGRMEVTGITVGEKLKVPRKWLKNLRAAIFQMEMFGCDEHEMMRIKGMLAYLAMVCGETEVYRKLYYRYLNGKHGAPMTEQHWSNLEPRGCVGIVLDLDALST